MRTVRVRARTASSSSTTSSVSWPPGELSGGAERDEPERRRRFLDARQIDLERGAAAHFAVDVDVAAGLLDDAVDGGQAQAGALARPLGGEERLEDLRLRGRVHAAAGVAHRQHHVAAGLNLRVRRA